MRDTPQDMGPERRPAHSDSLSSTQQKLYDGTVEPPSPSTLAPSLSPTANSGKASLALNAATWTTSSEGSLVREFFPTTFAESQPLGGRQDERDVQNPGGSGATAGGKAGGWHWSHLQKGPLKDTLAGAGAGCVSGIVTCPLDVLKTRLQYQALVTHKDYIPYRGIANALVRIFREEGIRGLYRGLTPLLIGYLPTWALYFPAYEGMKSLATSYLGIPSQSAPAHIISAMVAGAATSTATNPIWILKTRFMTQTTFTQHQYSGLADAVCQIWRTEGIKGFYKGLGISLVGVSHVVVQFPLYERLKVLLSSDESGKFRSIRILTASAISKIIASSITYPHEVIRTRLQNQISPPYKYRGIVHAAITIGREEGIRGFYQGLGTNMLRTVPASMMTLFTYELLTHLL